MDPEKTIVKQTTESLQAKDFNIAKISANDCQPACTEHAVTGQNVFATTLTLYQMIKF